MNAWILLVLVLGGIVTFVLIRETEPPAAEQPQPAPSTDEPDLYMEDAIITQYEEDGSLKYKLISDRVQHFETNNLTHLSNPKLDIHRGDNPPWNVRAGRGKISYEERDDGEQQELVYLQDDVYLEQTRGERFFSLRSEDLLVYPERRYAETDLAVMIDTNAGRTKAVGLTADLNLSLLHVSSSDTQRVHTIVLPFQFKP